MKKALLIIGIILLAAAALSLIFSALSRYGYYHTLDGSQELYARLGRRTKLFFALGIAFAAAGAACMIVRARL